MPSCAVNSSSTMSPSICFTSPGLTGPPQFRTLLSRPILNLLRTPQALLQALDSALPYPPPCHRFRQSHRIGPHHQQIHEPPKTVSSLFPLPTSPSLLHSFLDFSRARSCCAAQVSKSATFLPQPSYLLARITGRCPHTWACLHVFKM